MKRKLMAIVPMLTMAMPMTVFAATDYTTSAENVTYTDAITADSTPQVQVSVSQTSTFSVKIPKTITLNGKVGETNDASYEVEVSGNIASNEVVTVAPTTTFKMKDNSGVKADIDATVTQAVQKFVNSDAKEAKHKEAADTIALGKTNGTVEVANLTAGSWAGTFNFNISLSKVTFN